MLQRMGLKLERDRDGSIHISQPPGEANALGRIRFNFPNKFLVYQHDTPDKHLFAKDERAFSHGCMRVQNPDQYAATLLNITMPNEQLHAGEDPQHVRPQRDRPEIPDADPGQHHLPDRVRGRRRQAADPQGRLWPRRHHAVAAARTASGRDLENVVAHSQPSYSRPPGSSLPASVNFASDNSYSRTVVLRAAVRRPPTPPAPPAGRPPAAAPGDHPLIAPLRSALSKFLKQNQRSRPRARPFSVNHYPPRI